MSAITLFKAFVAGMTDYISKHNANYATIETTINQLLSLVTGQVGGSFQVPDGLKQIFDRKGIIGIGSYDFTEATLSGPNYNLSITAGAFWDGSSSFLSNVATTVISMSGKATGTWYLNLDTVGVPVIEATPGANGVRSFEWDSATHIVSAKALQNAVLFDGDDYADMLTSAARSKSFTKVADRLEEIEDLLAAMSGFYGFDYTDGLAFYFLAGLVRNDSDLYETIANHITCTDDTANFVEVDPASGDVSVNQVGFTSGLIPLWELVAASGEITEMTDKRTWCSAGGGGGGGGHTQNTDLGTSSAKFTLARTQAGTPSLDATLEVERGTSPNVAVRWNEATEHWEYTNDGTSWYNLGDVTISLGSQLVTRFVAIEDPEKVFEEIARDSSVDFEDLDLSSYMTAPFGVEAVVLQVFFWDDSPGPTTKVMFKKKGSAFSPTHAFSSWKDEMQPVTLIVPVDSDLFAQLFVVSSGLGTANLQVYLLGYFEKVTGVGTQNATYSTSGITVPASSEVETNVGSCLNRGLAHYLKVEETGGVMTGLYDIELYAKDTFLEEDLLYRATFISPLDDYEDFMPFWLRDEDASSELHVKIINSDAVNQGVFTVTVRCEKFA
jgi:hypothetical protein